MLNMFFNFYKKNLIPKAVLNVSDNHAQPITVLKDLIETWEPEEGKPVLTSNFNPPL